MVSAMEQQFPKPTLAPPVGAVTPDGQWQWTGMHWVPRFQTVVAIEPVRPKSKTVAILLAVFLAQWTWLYTYKRDSGLFWVNLLVVFFTGGAWLLVAWPWAIIHTCVRPEFYYEQFPNG